MPGSVINPCTWRVGRQNGFFVAAANEGVEDGVMSVFLLLSGCWDARPPAWPSWRRARSSDELDTHYARNDRGRRRTPSGGVGVLVVELPRIEQALRPAQPVKRPALPRPNRRRAFPFRPGQRRNPQPQPFVADTILPSPRPPTPAATAAPAVGQDGAFERLRAKIPDPARLEMSRSFDRVDVPHGDTAAGSCRRKLGRGKKARSPPQEG